MQSLILVLASCFLTAIGQVAFKYGMDTISAQGLTTDNLVNTLFVVLFNPIIILGFLCFGTGAVVWLFALAKLELSYAVPLSALTYIFILVASVIIFKEPLTAAKIGGTLLVAAGIGVLSFN